MNERERFMTDVVEFCKARGDAMCNTMLYGAEYEKCVQLMDKLMYCLKTVEIGVRDGKI